MREILDEAFDLLGDDIVSAHAKDLVLDKTVKHVAAGKGVLDYDTYFRLLEQSGYDGSVNLHGLDESEVDKSLAFVKGCAARWYLGFGSEGTEL